MKPHDFEKNTQDLLKSLEKAQLQDASKARMRETLSEYADFHTILDQVSTPSMDRSIERGAKKASPYQHFFGRMPMNVIAGLMIALVVGGGTSYAAESALPGDTLYPIKIGINEKLSGALAISTESEARHESALAERRLTETEKLAASGALDATLETELQTAADIHRDRSLALLSDVEAKGNTSIATDIRTDLEARALAHGGIMAVLGGDTAIAADTTSMAMMSAESAAPEDARAKNAVLSFDAALEADADATVTKEAAAKIILRAETVYEKARAKVSDAEAEVKAYVDVRLDAAALALTDAKASLEAGVYASAYASAEESLRAGKEALYFLSAAPELLLKLKVRTDRQSNTETNDATVREQHTREPESTEDTTETSVESEATIDISNDMIDTPLDINVEGGLNINLQ